MSPVSEMSETGPSGIPFAKTFNGKLGSERKTSISANSSHNLGRRSITETELRRPQDLTLSHSALKRVRAAFRFQFDGQIDF